MRHAIAVVAPFGVMMTNVQLGQWAMLGALVLMILVHELTHLIVARSFGFQANQFTIGLGSAPRWRLGTLWNTEFHITPWLLGGSADIDPSSDEARAKPDWQRIVVIMSGTMTNFMLALAIMFCLFVGVGERETVPNGISVQTVVGAESAAAEAGLRQSDKIVSVDGIVVKTWDELHKVLLHHVDGSGATVIVDRAGTRQTLTVHPDSYGRIGVKLQYSTTASYRQRGPLEALGRSLVSVIDMGKNFLAGVLMLLHFLPVPTGATDGSGDAHGLWSMIQLGGLAFGQGLYSFANLVAFFSVNLALCNLIPAPMFDGGHLVFYAWEKATGRSVPKELRHRLSRIVFWIVVAVMIYATYNDVLHPIA